MTRGTPIPDSQLIHASCVALSGRAVLIQGASGTGKSTLALQLMACGADLVADDQTLLRLRDGWPVASAPDPLRGMIEARGVGLLRAGTVAAARVALAIDMDTVETERLPPSRSVSLLGQPVPLFRRVEGIHFAPAVVLYLRGGKVWTE